MTRQESSTEKGHDSDEEEGSRWKKVCVQEESAWTEGLASSGSSLSAGLAGQH